MSILRRVVLSKTSYWKEKKSELEEVLKNFNKDITELNIFWDTFKQVSFIQKSTWDSFLFWNIKRDLLISINFLEDYNKISIVWKPYTVVTINK